MLSNTKSYYKKGSNENKDAVDLEALFHRAVAAVSNGEELTPALGEK